MRGEPTLDTLALVAMAICTDHWVDHHLARARVRARARARVRARVGVGVRVTD